MIILLDSGPLGLLTNPNKTPDAEACRAWQRRLVLAGHLPLIPAIIDYDQKHSKPLPPGRDLLNNPYPQTKPYPQTTP